MAYHYEFTSSKLDKHFIEYWGNLKIYDNFIIRNVYRKPLVITSIFKANFKIFFFNKPVWFIQIWVCMNHILKGTFTYYVIICDLKKGTRNLGGLWPRIGGHILRNHFLEVIDGILRPEVATVGCGLRPQHPWGLSTSYSWPEVATILCAQRAQDYLSHRLLRNMWMFPN